MDHETRMQIIHAYKELILKEVGGGGTCENCGKVIPHRSNMINTPQISYVYNGQVGSPGHPALPYLQCPIADHGEHWTCSPECWHAVAIDCLTNHQKPLLDEFHKKLNGGE